MTSRALVKSARSTKSRKMQWEMHNSRVYGVKLANQVGWVSKESFAQYRDCDSPLSRANVAFDVADLLPGAQNQLAVANRYHEIRAQQGSLQVRVAVAVVPGLFVAILARRGKQPVEGTRQILE